MKVPTVWDERYHCPQAGGLPTTEKQKGIVERAAASGWIDVRAHASFDEAAVWEHVSSVHRLEYVEAVRRGEPKVLAQSQGLRWSPELAASVARVWNGHVEACALGLEEGTVFHPVSGAHHARYRCGGGFCTFNFLVGGARALLDSGRARRVLVVDLDAHQGNGTWELAAGEERMGIFDLSGSDFGVPEVESLAEGRYARLVRSADDYFTLLARLSELVERFRPDLVQYQAGVDCHEDDVVGGIRGMTAERLRERDALVFETARSRGVPLVFNLAGGYQGAATVELHLATVREACDAR